MVAINTYISGWYYNSIIKLYSQNNNKIDQTSPEAHKAAYQSHNHMETKMCCRIDYNTLPETTDIVKQSFYK